MRFDSGYPVFVALNSEHIPEDLLESYAMEKLAELEAKPVEEHLLGCVECQERLAETDSFLGTMRAASKEIEDQKKRSGPKAARVIRRRPPATR
jgi:hypothetical protein